MNFPNINLLEVLAFLMYPYFLIPNVWWIFIVMFAVAMLGGLRARANADRKNKKRAEAERRAAKQAAAEQAEDSYYE